VIKLTETKIRRLLQDRKIERVQDRWSCRPGQQQWKQSNRIRKRGKI